MPEKTDYSNINPQVTDVFIGIRDLRKIQIYPLSMANQLELSDLITQAIAAFFDTQKIDDTKITMEFVSFMFSLIKDNLPKIFTYIAPDEGEGVFEEITNRQLAKIVEVVYKENFEGPAKKVRSLFPMEETDEMESFLESSLRPSAESTDTGSKTSTRKPIKKEA